MDRVKLDDIKEVTLKSKFLTGLRGYEVPEVSFHVTNHLRDPDRAPSIAEMIREFQEIIEASGKEKQEDEDNKASNKFSSSVNIITADSIITGSDGNTYIKV